MAQTPRDACEAALGLGGTRWGMVTDVIFPFSRDGIVGAVLLGFGRGLGETMIVVLVLSKANLLTSGPCWAPTDSARSPRRSPRTSRPGSVLDKSAPDAPGPGPLRHDTARQPGPGHRQPGEAPMASSNDPTRPPPVRLPARRRPLRGSSSSRSRSRPSATAAGPSSTRACSRPVGSAVASLALVWIVFTVAGITGPLGMAVVWFVLFFAIYGVLCWRALRRSGRQGPYGHGWRSGPGRWWRWLRWPPSSSM